ncbi:transferase [Segetibacter aerophilus]|uniref:Transferase n=2 Tax=Segetibacter aerophilus TaxID=670293 RepID=A0A512BD50_9BACT|nr:transferase [Segetibacter aerophilus]
MFSTIHNLIQIFKNNVEYISYPKITGRIELKNKGEFKIGRSVHFQCSSTSNFVGLFKTCTVSVTKGAKLFIDDFSGFSGISIFCSNSIRIGKYVNCGGNVAIWDTDFHPLEMEARRKHDIKKIVTRPVIIEDEVFIGANSIILKGVHIGKGAIIGAGSVVSKSIPGLEVWGGNPARYIRKTS